MKSNKQRRAELVARRRNRAAKAKWAAPRHPRAGMPPVALGETPAALNR
jgi:hypothetical protein